MSVKTFDQPDSASMICDTYPPAVDASVSVLSRLGDAFAPHAQTTPNMTVAIDAGHVFDGTALTEVAAQSASLTAPAANPRIDRIVVNQLTGVVSVVTGTEAASPAVPAIPSGFAPVAQVRLSAGATAITNDMITDERDLSALGRIIAVEAGTGLTGGGSSGTVTIGLETPVAVALGGTGTATAAAGTVFAGPASGSDAAPSFRSLTLADLPADVATTEEILTAVSVGAPPVGSTRNLRLSVTTVSSSTTMYWDEAILKTALGGVPYVVSNVAGMTINLAAIGAGGMDVGTAPASGYVAIYGAYNPTSGEKCLFAQDATSVVAPQVYGGANAPTGYTATALLSVLATDDNGKFKLCQQRERLISFPLTNILQTQGSVSANTTSPATALSVSSVVPPNAVSIGGVIGASSTSSSNLSVMVGSDVNMSGLATIEVLYARIAHGVFDVNIAISQYIYYETLYSDGVPTFAIHASKYMI